MGSDGVADDLGCFQLENSTRAVRVSRLPIYERVGLYSPPTELRRLDAWRGRLCARESVARSLPPNAEEMLRHHLASAKA